MRLLKVLNGMITAGLLILMAGSGILAFTARRSPDGIPTVLGQKIMAVTSGSMEPFIHTGDVITLAPVAPGAEIREGDVITYRARERADMFITHRVVGIVRVNGQPAAYVTKGDANAAEDLSTVRPEQVIGRYQWRLPYFGYVARFMRTVPGILLFVVLPGVVVIGLEFRKIWQALSEAEAARTARGKESEP